MEFEGGPLTWMGFLQPALGGMGSNLRPQDQDRSLLCTAHGQGQDVVIFLAVDSVPLIFVPLSCFLPTSLAPSSKPECFTCGVFGKHLIVAPGILKFIPGRLLKAVPRAGVVAHLAQVRH